MDIKLSPKSIALFFLGIVLFLLIAHLSIHAVRFITDVSFLSGPVQLFNLGSDTNVPTFYSSVAILVCASLLTLVGIAGREDRRIHASYWFGLALIFVFLAVDEIAMVHERATVPLQDALNTSGAFHFAWVIPYGLAVLVVLAVYVRFLLRLPVRTATLFVIAGGTFVTGALAFEMLSGWHLDGDPSNYDAIYVALQTIEETFEMVGIVVFIYALTDYVDRQLGGLRLSIAAASGAEPPAE